MNTSAPAANIMVPVQRIYSEYLDMPGLRLTSAQVQPAAARNEAAVCANALELLVNAGFLRLTPADQYVRVTEGVVVPPFRMAKLSFVLARADQKVS